jgi:hypothetical protein
MKLPHDMEGVKLQPGDEVLIRAKVSQVYQLDKDDSCNVDLQVVDAGKHEIKYLPHIVCNSKLCLYIPAKTPEFLYDGRRINVTILKTP